MTPVEFARDWRRTRDMANENETDRYLTVTDTVEGREFEIARWSRYDRSYDTWKLECYLEIPAARFGEALALMLEHTATTGIGKLVTFRLAPRFVLDPGGRWRSCQAARLGVRRSDYITAMSQTSFVRKLIRQETEARKIRLSANAMIEALDEANTELAEDLAAGKRAVHDWREEDETASAPDGD